jgi:hypothetical protein
MADKQVRNDEGVREDANSRWFYLAVLTAGIAMYGHPVIGLVFVVPLGVAVIGFSQVKAKFSWVVRYFMLSLLIGSAGLSHFFSTIIKSFSGGGSEKYVKLEGVNFQDLFPGGLASLNYLVMGVLGGATVLWLLSRFVIKFALRHPKLDSGSKQIPGQARNDEKVGMSHDNDRGSTGGLAQPYFVGLIYLIIFFSLMIAGFNPLSGLLHGPRLAWVGSLVMAGLAASLFGRWSSLRSESKFTTVTLGLLTWGGAVVLAVVIWWYRPTLLGLIKQHAGTGYPYPWVVTKNYQKTEIEGLERELIPDWLETKEKNYRLYSLDDRLNMWWNGLYDLPQVRGYYAGVSPPEKEAFLGQLDTSVMEDEMVRDKGLTVEEAIAVAKFYLDWYGVKYLGITPLIELSSYLNNDSVIARKEMVQGINYLELDEEVGSPILLANNSPTLCVLGSDQGYNYLLRTMAKWGWDSEELVIIKGPGRVSRVSKEFLSACDSLVIYDLKAGVNLNPISKGRGWSAIIDRVKQGVSIFIDSGEAGSVGNQGLSLPKVFPVDSTEQEAIEEEWRWQVVNDDGLLGNVEVNDFSPPRWEEYGWKLSYGKPDMMRDWAEIVLKHEDGVVLAKGKLGEGEAPAPEGAGQVIWSGLNLPFHADYYQNRQEMGLLRKIVEQITTKKLKDRETEIPKDEITEESLAVEWISPQERRIVVSNAKGVLFKENGWPGWTAKTDTGKRLKIYHVGPNYPGFMYVSLPEGFVGVVNFVYRGSLMTWMSYAVAGLITILVLEQILIKGKFSGVLWGSRGKKFGKTFSLKKWWESEDE